MKGKKIMVIAIDPKRQSEIEIDGTVFLVRPLTAGEVANIRDGSVRYENITGNPDEARIIPNIWATYERAAKAGLVGWRNFNDEQNQPVEFSAATIERVPVEVLFDIGKQVWAKNRLEDDDRKN